MGKKQCGRYRLDIQLHQKTGIQVAEELRKIHPELVCVFCTAYKKYAVEAIEKQLTDGYILKPIQAEKIQEKMNQLIENGRLRRYLVKVKLDENKIPSLYNKRGEKIRFDRNITEQVFWVLFEQKGKVITSDELCDKIWKDDQLYQQNKKYLWSALSYLSKTLESNQAGEVLIREKGRYMLEMSLIHVDKSIITYDLSCICNVL